MKWHGDNRRKKELERQWEEAVKETLGGHLNALHEARKVLERQFVIAFCESLKIDKLCDFISKKIKKEK